MKDPARKPDAVQGTLDLVLLKMLSREPQHGYGLASRIQQITDDGLRIEEGSLYPALHRMEQAGWVSADWQLTDNGRKARIYRLTRTGRKRLSQEEAKWDRLTQSIAKILRFA